MSMHKLRTIEMHRLTVGEFKESAKIPLIVVLDDVRSAYNVGSVFRTCDAFRVEKVCLCGITATPPSTEIHKTALGGEDSVDWEYFKDTADCVRKLHAQGYFVWSIEQVEHSVKLQNLDAQSCIPAGLSDAKSGDETKFQGVAVILGNEVKGVRQDIVDMSDGCLEIPQYGTKHSLNVSITAGIVIWEFAKRLIPELSKDK